MAVRTYLKTALSISIFLAAIGGAVASPATQAQPQYPSDGAIITGEGSGSIIYTRLVFIPGATAVEYKGYFSDDYSKVASRQPDANLGPPPYPGMPEFKYTFWVGNPGVPPADETLVRGTKYYWTVDETDALGNTFTGDIWEFTILGFYAFEPSPPNEATFVGTDVLLSWQPGYGVQEHDIYMSTSWEDVNNARYGYFEPPPEFVATVEEPNILVTGLLDNTTYYWRVDEVSGRYPPIWMVTLYKGPVWCFTTEPEGLGAIRMDLWWNISCPPPCFLDYYYYPDSPDETRILTSFNSGTDLGEDYGGLIYGWLHPRKSGDYTFWLSTDEDGELFLSTDERPTNMERIAYVNGYAPPYDWYHRSSQQSVPIPLVAGRKYYIMARWQEGGGGDHCMVAWHGPDQPLAPVDGSSDAIIPGSRLSPFVQYWAHSPDPCDGQTDVALPVTLRWEPGENAAEHNVYISTNFNSVKNAFYDPRYPPPSVFLATTTEPNLLVTGLDFDTTYYWRVDEIDPSPLPPSFPYVSYYRGDVWSFTTEANRIFVDMDATGANDGTSWENAYNFLQDALVDANSSEKPVEIWVAEGIYTPDSNSADPNGSGDRMATFKLIDGVTLKGGYAGFGQPNPNARDIEIYETILSGDLDDNDGPDFANNDENSYNVVTGSGTDETAVLDGFTITAGNANKPLPPLPVPLVMGAEIYNYSLGSLPTNYASEGESMGWEGGGMYNDAGSPTLSNCTLRMNWARWGAGMQNRNGSNATLTNCNFSRNSAKLTGGGLLNTASSPSLSNCTFSGNVTTDSYSHGGGMTNGGYSSPILTNCTIIANSAEYEGGGIYNIGSSPILTSCTFSGNSAGWGGAMYNYNSSPTLINCILWGNSYPEIHGSAVVTYSDVQGGWAGVGNIDADPCFVDATGGDLRLSWDSPCIDTGDNNAPNLPATDLDGHPRIIDGDCNDTEVVDMGAFEFNYAYMGDFDYNCTVDFLDLSIFGLAWMSQPGDFNWDFACNISVPADNVIDRLDLAAFVDNWLAGF